MRKHKGLSNKTITAALVALFFCLSSLGISQAGWDRDISEPMKSPPNEMVQSFNQDKPYSAWIVNLNGNAQGQITSPALLLSPATGSSPQTLMLSEPHLSLSTDNRLLNMNIPGDILIEDLADPNRTFAVQYPLDNDNSAVQAALNQNTDNTLGIVTFTPTSSRVFIEGKDIVLPQTFNSFAAPLSWNAYRRFHVDNRYTLGTLCLMITPASLHTVNNPHKNRLPQESIPAELLPYIVQQGSSQTLTLDLKTTYTFTASLYPDGLDQKALLSPDSGPTASGHMFQPQTDFTLCIIQTIVISIGPEESLDLISTNGMNFPKPFPSPSKKTKSTKKPALPAKNPAQSSQPAQPVEPSQPTAPAQPTTPVEPSPPPKEDPPTEPSQPSEPIEPTEPAQPSEPVEPSQPNEP